MLEIRTCCENYNKNLPNESEKAMKCTHEYTFCTECVHKILCNVYSNCGGEFEKRPTRPKSALKKHPVKKDDVFNPVKNNQFLLKNKNIDSRVKKMLK